MLLWEFTNIFTGLPEWVTGKPTPLIGSRFFARIAVFTCKHLDAGRLLRLTLFVDQAIFPKVYATSGQHKLSTVRITRQLAARVSPYLPECPRFFVLHADERPNQGS